VSKTIFDLAKQFWFDCWWQLLSGASLWDRCRAWCQCESLCTLTSVCMIFGLILLLLVNLLLPLFSLILFVCRFYLFIYLFL
jgi:hypothetical protein